MLAKPTEILALAAVELPANPKRLKSPTPMDALPAVELPEKDTRELKVAMIVELAAVELFSKNRRPSKLLMVALPALDLLKKLISPPWLNPFKIDRLLPAVA